MKERKFYNTANFILACIVFIAWYVSFIDYRTSLLVCISHIFTKLCLWLDVKSITAKKWERYSAVFFVIFFFIIFVVDIFNLYPPPKPQGTLIPVEKHLGIDKEK